MQLTAEKVAQKLGLLFKILLPKKQKTSAKILASFGNFSAHEVTKMFDGFIFSA
jgi:hypothetical protein